MKSELDLFKRELETERRKTGELKDMGRREQQEYQNQLNSEREKIGKKIQEQDSRYKDVERKFADQMRKSDLMESELEKYKN